MAKKKVDDMSYVFCLWELLQPEKGSFKWDHVYTYAVDGDGHLVWPQPREDKYVCDDNRESYRPFMFTPIWRHENGKWLDKPPEGMDEDDADDVKDHREIMGRAVTIWSMESGVRLARFHPPKWARWLSPQFFEELQKLPNWFSLIEDGYTLWAGTARQVEKLLREGNVTV